MTTRKIPLMEGEYYHVFNRGVDKRIIFQDKYDLERFLISMKDFNSVEPIGSIYEHSFNKSKLGHQVSKFGKNKPLVEFVAYCLNPNHFHFLIKQVAEKGIARFMQRLGGYTKYFNEKYKRSGSLFPAPFKSVHIESNEQLLYVSGYVNLNNCVHGIKSNLYRSSWNEYGDLKKNGICEKDIVLGQFGSIKEYRKIAEETVAEIRRKREESKIADLVLE